MSASRNVLVVTAGDALADIAVLDGGLDPVAHGIGRLQTDLSPGLYKVHVRSGPSVTEHLVALDRDREVRVGLAQFPSPIPLAGTSSTHEAHMGLVSDVSLHAGVTLGTGASILVVARDWSSEDNHEAHRTDDPAIGLSLCRADGTRLAEIAGSARTARSTNGDPVAAWHANVDPGPYRLLLALPDGTGLERALYAAPGLQTQIFFLQRDYRLHDETTVRRADFSGAAMSTPPSGGFSATSDRTRMGEIARYALTQSQPVLSDDLLRQLLDEKFDDPMLGLLGAHVLLRDKPDETSLFRIVTGNLLRLLGQDHPDLRALWLRRTDYEPGGVQQLPSPPMLRASWDIAVAESVRTPALIPPDSTCGQIADRTVPAATWLLWRRGTTGADSGSEAIQQALRQYLEARARLDQATVQASSPRPTLLARIMRRPAQRLTQAFLPLMSIAPLMSVAPFSLGERDAPVSAPPPVPELNQTERMELARSFGVSGHLLDTMLRNVSLANG